MSESLIPWCTWTFNPITGCRHGCEYCYARKMVHRFSGDVRENKLHTEKYHMNDGIYILDEPFTGPDGKIITAPFGFEPTYHRYRLESIKKKKGGFNIFVGSLSDVFGDWVPEWILNEIFRALDNPHNNYLFLTKNPKRYVELMGVLPDKDNYWYGATVTDNQSAEDRILYLDTLYMEGFKTFVSVEPLHERFESHQVELTCSADWVIIGAETGNRKDKPVVKKEWIEDFVKEAKAFNVPIFMKESIRDIVPKFLTEYPPILAENVDRAKRRSYEDKVYCNCRICGKNDRKANMMTLSVRNGRGGKSETVGFMCPECFEKFWTGITTPRKEVEDG